MKENLALKILVLLISIFLWFQQTLLEEQMATLSVPMQLSSIPNDLVTEPNSISSIPVQIKARGTDIFLIKILSAYFKIDAKDFRYGKNLLKISLSNLILPEHFNIHITELNTANNFTISMDRMVTKSKYVHINYSSAKDIEFFLKNRINEKRIKVKVRGAMTIINPLKYIETEKITRKMVKNNKIRIRLIPKNKEITLLEPEITLDVKQQKLVSKTLSLVPIQFSHDKKVTLIPQKVTFMVRGPENIINNLDNNAIKAFIEDTNLEKNGFAEIKFQLSPGIKIIDYTPRKVQVIVNE